MEQRKTRRFQLVLPVSVTRAGVERITVSGFTKNISSSGVLFTAVSAPQVGGPVEYVITLPDGGAEPVRLRCLGKVLRWGRLNGNGDGLCDVAVTLERYEFVRQPQLQLVR